MQLSLASINGVVLCKLILPCALGGFVRSKRAPLHRVPKEVISRAFRLLGCFHILLPRFVLSHFLSRHSFVPGLQGARASKLELKRPLCPSRAGVPRDFGENEVRASHRAHGARPFSQKAAFDRFRPRSLSAVLAFALTHKQTFVSVRPWATAGIRSSR